METVELKRIWNTLAKEKLIDKRLAKENILEIITQKGNGIISKLQSKHKRDFRLFVSVVILIPLLILFIIYRDSQGLIPESSTKLGGPYLILCLIEAFMIYTLMSVKRNLNFINHTYNIGTLKESLTNVKSYFKAIAKKDYWRSTITMIFILAFIEVDTLVKIGEVSNLNFSSTGSFIFESYFSIFLIILIIFTPFIAKLEAKKYTAVLSDLDQTIEELNEEELPVSV